MFERPAPLGDLWYKNHWSSSNCRCVALCDELGAKDNHLSTGEVWQLGAFGMLYGVGLQLSTSITG